MRLNRLVIVFALLIAVCPQKAQADTYTYGTLEFTVTSGSPTPTGSFTLDDTTNTFTSFTVNWDGAAFDFDGVLGSAIALSGYWCGQASLFSAGIACVGNDGTFAFANQLYNGIPVASYIGADPDALYTNISAFAYGSYTTTETAVPTPEPTSFAFTLSGVVLLGLMLAMRKSLRLPQSN
jgi:hypothetical protein